MASVSINGHAYSSHLDTTPQSALSPLKLNLSARGRPSLRVSIASPFKAFSLKLQKQRHIERLKVYAVSKEEEEEKEDDEEKEEEKEDGEEKEEEEKEDDEEEEEEKEVEAEAAAAAASSSSSSEETYIYPDYLVKKLTAEQLNTLIKSERTTPLVVDFYATWCGPCILLAQQLEMLAVEYGETVRIVKIDTDEEYQLANRLKIRGLPTMLLISPDRKKLAIRTEGLLPIETIKSIIETEL